MLHITVTLTKHQSSARAEKVLPKPVPHPHLLPWKTTTHTKYIKYIQSPTRTCLEITDIAHNMAVRWAIKPSFPCSLIQHSPTISTIRSIHLYSTIHAAQVATPLKATQIPAHKLSLSNQLASIIDGEREGITWILSLITLRTAAQPQTSVRPFIFYRPPPPLPSYPRYEWWWEYG